MTGPTLLIAPDKFKGTVSAGDVAALISEGVQQTCGDITCVSIPMADGGDGTLEALLAQGWVERAVQATDAAGVTLPSRIAVRGDRCVVELAEICGIAGLHGRLRPWQASSRGVGEALRQAVMGGALDVTVALGGSASTDGGAGLLKGLGFAVRDARGRTVADGLEGLRSAVSIVPPPDLQDLLCLRWTILSDVQAPLHGPDGAAYVFGPQKGLRSDEIEEADDLLKAWDRLLEVTFDRRVGSIPGAGAAGGAAAALLAACGAEVMPGATYLAEATGLVRAMRSAGAVVTGEGRFDASSRLGKAPGHVLRLAGERGLRRFVVAGSVDAEALPMELDGVYSLTELAGDPTMAQREPRRYLVTAGRLIGESLRSGGRGGGSMP